MRRHFRRLAGYLQDAVVRENVSANDDWFTQAVTAVKEFVLRLVKPKPDDRYRTAVPLIPLKAAAGAFSDPQIITDGEWEWVEPDTTRKLRPGMFVAKVVGKSMEPAIPDGSYCLFASPVTGSRSGKTVLVQMHEVTDPESGERFTVKRYESEKQAADDGTWRHVKITLHPVNKDFSPILLTTEDEGSVAVVAEVVEVLR
jgi:phage repressor protein C with HTH and peptisase S24 domain